MDWTRQAERVSGAFDIPIPTAFQPAAFAERKALFTGATYPLGRSSEILHLAPNIVSNEHALLITEKQAIADVVCHRVETSASTKS